MSNRLPNKTCDCGQPGYRKDGSGWFCRECERVTEFAATLVTQAISAQREDSHSPERKAEYWQGYQARKAA